MKTWIKSSSTVVAAMLCVLAQSPACAQQRPAPSELETLKRMMEEVISQNQDLRRRVRELEESRTKQEQATKEAAREAAKELAKEAPPKEPAKEEAPREPAKDAKGALGRLQFGGAIEVGAIWTKKFSGLSGSELKLETAEFDLEAKLDWAKGALVLGWDRDQDKVTVDEALIILGEKYPVTLTLGKGTVPFGLSTGTTVAAKLEDTLTLTDPLTLSVFDATEEFVGLTFNYLGFHGGAYVFRGDTNNRTERHIEHYGANLSYAFEHDIWSFKTGVSMIDSVFDSDGLSDAFPEALRSKYVPGVAGYFKVGVAGFSLGAAYYAAVEQVKFDRDEERVRLRPAAWHVELGYLAEIFGAKTFGAVGYSETRELGGAFPKRRRIATVGRWLLDDLRLTLDYSHDDDYDRLHGGTNKSSDAYTVRLTFEW